MKEKINPEKITLEGTWKIAKEFGKLLAENKISLPYEFEDILPYEKSIILLCLVKILKEEDFKKLAIINNTTEKEIKENIATMIIFLDGFMPNPEQYKKMIESKEFTGKVLKLNNDKNLEECSDNQLNKILKKLK